MNAVPVVGQPLAYGLGLAVATVIVATGSWARSLVTVAHEGGHMVMAVVTLRDHEGFKLGDGGGGGTTVVNAEWGVGDLLTRFVGYPAPCLLGLGGSALVARGGSWSVLWASVLLLIAAFFTAANPLANAVTLLAFLGVGWTAVSGGPDLQAAVAVGLVWWLLIGGAYYSTVGLSRGDGSDAYWLARRTWIPRIVWHGVWAAIGVSCLWFGARAILGL